MTVPVRFVLFHHETLVRCSIVAWIALASQLTAFAILQLRASKGGTTRLVRGDPPGLKGIEW